MQNSLISVIVPAYRVEQYIEKCITSLTAQTYENLEILIACTPESADRKEYTDRMAMGKCVLQTGGHITVRQESPDDATLTRCRALAAKDPRIHVLENTEFGVSNARNLALERARGDYIAFVDADDWVREDYIELLYSTILGTQDESHSQDVAPVNDKATDESDAQERSGNTGSWNTAIQMAICGFERAAESRCVQELLSPADPASSNAARPSRHAEVSGKIARLNGSNVVYMTQTQLLEQVLCNNAVGGYLWNKLFDADIIRRRKLRFRPELCIGEDMVFIAQYIKSVVGANYLNRVLYSYRTNAGSALQKMYATGSADLTKIESNLRAATMIRKLYQRESSENAGIYQAVHYRLVRTGMWAYFNLLKCSAYDRQMLWRIQNMMRGSWRSYCQSPYARRIEKLISGMVRVAPCISFRILSVIIRIVPDGLLKRYVKG